MSFCASFIFFWGWGFQGFFSFLSFTSARCHFLSLVSQLMHVLVNVSLPAFFLLGAGIACCVLDSLLACCVLVSLLSHPSNYFLQSFLFFLIFFYLLIILFVLLVSQSCAQSWDGPSVVTWNLTDVCSDECRQSCICSCLCSCHLFFRNQEVSWLSSVLVLLSSPPILLHPSHTFSFCSACTSMSQLSTSYYIQS